MLSLSRLLPGSALLLRLLVSILAVTVTAAPTVNESGKQVVKLVLAQGLRPLALQKYDGPWTSPAPSELDVGIQIGTGGYYATRNAKKMIQIEPGPNSADGLIIGKVKMQKAQNQFFWTHIGKFEYESKFEFLEEVLGLIKEFDFEQNNVEASFEKSMVEKVKQHQM
ncbi:hypothetical protein F5050DRAFT_468772 [Lentinula boryana]|uniref:Uncharacterized protein n=1 Tax=Lentinula boryana TaxID=40481 RepID=A0ABQ8Q7N3_9AGAR|nr:hypothetical protein F5050DRAFT_468772 [Lentinula boryana]